MDTSANAPTARQLAELIPQLAAANARVAWASAAEAQVVADFIKTAPLPGITVHSLTVNGAGSIIAEVTAETEVGGAFGTRARTLQARGSIAAISTAAPTRTVKVVAR